MKRDTHRNVITDARECMLRAGIPEATVSLIEPFGHLFLAPNLLDGADDFQWLARRPLPVPALYFRRWALNVSRDHGVEMVHGLWNRGRFRSEIGCRLLTPEIVGVLTALRDLPFPAEPPPATVPNEVAFFCDHRVFVKFIECQMKGYDDDELERALLQERHWVLMAYLRGCVALMIDKYSLPATA